MQYNAIIGSGEQSMDIWLGSTLFCHHIQKKSSAFFCSLRLFFRDVKKKNIFYCTFLLETTLSNRAPPLSCADGADST